MHSKLKVMTVVGTRPEVIRLSRVIAVLDEATDHVLVHTGQNYDYELNEIFFNDLGLKKPKHFLNIPGASVAETIGNIISKSDAVFQSERPDAILILGDTNSCLCAIAAKRRKIPIFHMEAGNRCFDMRVPEEINRKIVDHISDVNLCYTEHARRNLLAEGLPPDRIIKTGSPMKEILDYHRASIDASSITRRLGIVPNGYFTVSLHREENVDNLNSLRNFIEVLDLLSKTYSFPVIFSIHPRTQTIMKQNAINLPTNVNGLKPLGFFDYISLQKSAFCTLSDSGTITEESSILGFPAVTIRETQERPEGMDEGSVIMTGSNPARILQSIELTRLQHSTVGALETPIDYCAIDVSWKVVKTIFSYTDYINRVVWKR